MATYSIQSSKYPRNNSRNEDGSKSSGRLNQNLHNSIANVSPAYLVWKEASISKEFEVERQDEGAKEDETGEEEDIGDVVWSVAAAGQCTVAVRLTFRQRPVRLQSVELTRLPRFCINHHHHYQLTESAHVYARGLTFFSFSRYTK